MSLHVDLCRVGPQAALELEDPLGELLDEGLRVLNGGRLAGGRTLAPARVLVVHGLLMLAIGFPSEVMGQGTAQQTTSVTEGYAGSSIPIDITILNASEWDPPVMPDIEGLEIERITGGQSSMTQIINGVRTDRTQVTYTFAITADNPGSYEIPSFPIIVDGQTLQSRPVTLRFRPSENNGLLRVEVSGNPDRHQYCLCPSRKAVAGSIHEKRSLGETH